jgi:hypothetical protein
MVDIFISYYENISLSIEYMFSETRKILHEMPGE